MKLRTAALALAALALASLALGSVVALAFQEEEGLTYEMPGPTEHHAVLEKFVGTWDSTITMAAGGPATQGTMVWELEMGGMWLLGEYAGTFMGSPYHGRSINGYDADAGKYTGVWVSSGESRMSLTEGTYDAATRTLTLRGEGRDFMDPSETVVEIQVTQFKSDDEIAWKMMMPGADGSPVPVIHIDYKRKR